MGLVQNLKKTLTNWAERILVELSYHYIKQVAKQTMKRRDNSSSMEFSPNLLTTESQGTTIATSSADTSEKTTMNTTTEEIVGHLREWSLERAADKSVSREDARAILAEFYEWIEPEDDEIEIVSLDSKN
jgi:hypothetical protein